MNPPCTISPTTCVGSSILHAVRLNLFAKRLGKYHQDVYHSFKYPIVLELLRPGDKHWPLVSACPLNSNLTHRVRTESSDKQTLLNNLPSQFFERSLSCANARAALTQESQPIYLHPFVQSISTLPPHFNGKWPANFPDCRGKITVDQILSTLELQNSSLPKKRILTKFSKTNIS